MYIYKAKTKRPLIGKQDLYLGHQVKGWYAGNITNSHGQQKFKKNHQNRM